MSFNLNYSVKPENLLLLTMVNTYNSMVGLVNIIFTLSMILLGYRFWPDVNIFIKIAIASGIMIFPVFQPIFIYLKSMKIVSNIPEDLKMNIKRNGIKVSSKSDNTVISREELKVSKIKNMIILNAGRKGIYILNKDTLNGMGDELYSFLLC